MKFISSLLLFLLPLIVHSQNSGIEVNLNTGKRIYTNSIYIYSNYSNSYARINGRSGEKISIDRISYIQGTDKSGHERHFDPIRLGGNKRWGERTFMSDRIKIYSTTKFDLEYPGKAGNIYFKDNQSAQSFKYRFLKQDLSDNADSMDYLKKANGLRTTQVILWSAAIGFFVTGVAQMVNSPLEEPGESISIPPVILLAITANLTAWVLEFPKNDKFREALQNYK